MAGVNFDEALRCLLVHEGGYSNHPSDPGGPTKHGITLAVYRKYVKPDANADDVRAMPVAEAKAIYRARYWNVMLCDALPPGVDYAVFDYAVNSGTARAGKVLRRVLKLDSRSSSVSEDVVKAAQAADTRVLIEAICDERLRFLQSLKTWSVFGAGWSRRVSEVRRVSLVMADPPPVRKKTNISIVAGGAIAGGMVTAQQAHPAGAGATVVAAVMAIGVVGLAVWWFWWRRKALEA